MAATTMSYGYCWPPVPSTPPPEWVNPFLYAPPIAPHIAAREAGRPIDIAVIRRAFERLQTLADVVWVEGVGGFRVPLDERYDTADLARILALPVILVVGMRLGCLNHALLTAEAITRRGLTLAGWVANRIDPAMAVSRRISKRCERGWTLRCWA